MHNSLQAYSLLCGLIRCFIARLFNTNFTQSATKIRITSRASGGHDRVQILDSIGQ